MKFLFWNVSSTLGWLTLLYGMQGIPYGFQVAFLPILLHSSGTSLTKVSLLRVLNLPWMLKLLWAPLVASSPSVHRPLTVSLIGLATTFAALSLSHILSDWIWGVAIALLVINVLVSVQDIAVDAYAIRALTDRDVGGGNAVQVVAYKIGGMLGGGVLTAASQFCPWNVLMICVAVLYVFAATLVTLGLPESQTPKENTLYPNVPTSNGNALESSQHHAFDVKQSSGQLEHQIDLEPSVPFESDDTNTKVFAPCSQRNCLLQSNSHEMSCGKEPKHHTYNLRRRKKQHVPENSTSSLLKADRRVSEEACTETPSSGADRDASMRTSFQAPNDNVKHAGQSQEAHSWRLSWRRMGATTADIFDVPNTASLLVYLLVYKLGEQGMVSMYPLYLLDRRVSANHVALWTGMLAQWLSIGGSVLGGWLVSASKPNRILPRLLAGLCVCRAAFMATLSFFTQTSSTPAAYGEGFILSCLSLYLTLVVGGAITTATFTLMMTSAQRASSSSAQTLYHTSMATAEVMGKVFFTSLAGLIVDRIGYVSSFYWFTAISFLPLIPLFNITRSL